MKKITINGETFEVVTSNKASQEIITRIDRSSLENTIFDIYGRPSITKIDIYKSWTKWFEGVEKTSGRLGCMAGNTSTFTIGSKYQIDGKTIYLLITKGHNKAVIK